MLRALASLPRRLRWALRRWSPTADREFHDALFAAQRYDPFSFAYPGYLTIRRFADLTDPHLAGVSHAVDLGCGPGEITCELARRHPGIRFTGVDHSVSAIARARQHQETLALANVEFIAADVSTFTPDAPDVVLMYDSFHHLLDPAGFVRRLATRVPRFVLVEPAGDWLGGSQRTLEFDWIPSAVDAIRARLAWQLNLDGGRPPVSADAIEERGEPVEHRYPLQDLKHFFEGYGLTVRGTFFGIDEYPPDPYSTRPLREEFGRVTYDALVAIEELLRQQDLDLHAKHWVIYAERDAPHRLRAPRPVNPRTDVPDALKAAGQYDVEYGAYDGPSAVSVAAAFSVDVTLKNRGWREWRSDDPSSPINASYHWIRRDGVTVVEDGVRTPLPRMVKPGETFSMSVNVQAPDAAGQYTLAIDLVEEGVAWFSRAGAPTLRRPLTVK